MVNTFVENAKRIGKETAELIGLNNLPLTCEQVQNIVKDYEIKLIIIPIDDKNSNLKVRAIYDHKLKQIVVEEASIITLQSICNSTGFGPVSRSDILVMHIAHELFHHLEEIGKVPLSLYYNYGNQNNYKNKLLHLKSIISRITGPSLVNLREAAAHSFVKTLLGLSISPELIEKQF